MNEWMNEILLVTPRILKKTGSTARYSIWSPADRLLFICSFYWDAKLTSKASSVSLKACWIQNTGWWFIKGRDRILWLRITVFFFQRREMTLLIFQKGKFVFYTALYSLNTYQPRIQTCTLRTHRHVTAARFVRVTGLPSNRTKVHWQPSGFVVRAGLDEPPSAHHRLSYCFTQTAEICCFYNDTKYLPDLPTFDWQLSTDDCPLTTVHCALLDDVSCLAAKVADPLHQHDKMNKAAVIFKAYLMLKCSSLQIFSPNFLSNKFFAVKVSAHSWSPFTDVRHSWYMK